MKLSSDFFKYLIRGVGKFVALAAFFANTQNPHAGIFVTQDI
jgi:hypothetical protein